MATCGLHLKICTRNRTNRAVNRICEIDWFKAEMTNNTKTTDRPELHKTIWHIANDLRDCANGGMDVT